MNGGAWKQRLIYFLRSKAYAILQAVQIIGDDKGVKKRGKLPVFISKRASNLTSNHCYITIFKVSALIDWKNQC